MKVPQVRHNIVEGLFYPADPDQLLREMPREPQGDYSFLMLPHADWALLGDCLSKAWPKMQPHGATILLLGPRHRETQGPACFPQETRFHSALGDIILEQKLMKQICSRSDLFVRDSTPHEEEHCLEVHLPMIRHFFPGLRLLPLLLGEPEMEDLAEIAQLLKEIVAPLSNLRIILSGNMTGFTQKEKAGLERQKLADLLSQGFSPERLYKEKDSYSSCAVPSLCLLKKAELLPEKLYPIHTHPLEEGDETIYYESWGGRI